VRYVYLSPDAPAELPSGALFPPNTVFVVGGLVDRRIQRGRSQDRAVQCHVESARLPLAAAHAKVHGDIVAAPDDEPLNVDTVLEALLFWRAGFQGKALDLGTAVKYAVVVHAKRHPKRVEHSGTFADGMAQSRGDGW